MRPLVCEYLLTHSLMDLKNEFGINSRIDNSGTKFSLNYDQILAKSGDLFVEQCRGLVLRSLKDNLTNNIIIGETLVVAWPMNRFYNCDDPHVAKINYADKNLTIFEKLDGTMIVCYYDHYLNAWCAGTRGVCDGSIPIQGNDIVDGEITFSQLFFRTLEQICNHNDVGLRKENTYVFELTSPLNKCVVNYRKPNITLLAARNTSTGTEIHIKDLTHVCSCISRPKVFKFSSLKEMVYVVNCYDADKFEGVVAIDLNFNRVKIKNKSWVLASRAKEMYSASKRNILKLIIDDQVESILKYVDNNIANKILNYVTAYNKFTNWFDQSIIDCDVQSSDRKSFAFLVKSTAPNNFTAPYFAIKDKKASSTKEWAQKFVNNDNTIDKLIEILETKFI